MPPRPNLLTQEINLNPLVDLVLVLLILLVVVIPMLRPASLPESHAPVRSVASGHPAPVPVQAPVLVDHLAVAIGADGAVFIEQRRVAREELGELLVALHDAGPNRSVLVKGDRHLRYRQVRQLMADLYRAGFQRVALTLDVPPVAG